MKTQMVALFGKVVAVAVLAVALAFGGSALDVATAEHSDGENYFVKHPGSAGGRTDVDQYDLYAPVDYAEEVTSPTNFLVAGSFASATQIGGEWAMPPSHERPGEPY